MLWIVGISTTTDNLKSCASQQKPRMSGVFVVVLTVHLAAIGNDEPSSVQTPASAGRY
ncbi:hypothetical protein NDK37_20905 [Xanthomonas citri pv. glycines]|uniref:hypothetical protein n=1 Tax=Xanthomonas TaxID=338 RepID=UPI0012B56C63|nr:MULTISPECIES: hypothetical protein [Xanthomonas]WLA19593.1 hypothetical protein NDK37_20905 [Xanthomonas citri pv. glycines]WLA29084.1 hypothetical protein NPS81_20095 [Xanthomonas citri pv. glycines]